MFKPNGLQAFHASLLAGFLTSSLAAYAQQNPAEVPAGGNTNQMTTPQEEQKQPLRPRKRLRQKLMNKIQEKKEKKIEQKIEQKMEQMQQQAPSGQPNPQ